MENWGVFDEDSRPRLTVAVPGLKVDLSTLGKFAIYLVPPRKNIRAQIHMVYYLMVDSIGMGFGSVF